MNAIEGYGAVDGRRVRINRLDPLLNYSVTVSLRDVCSDRNETLTTG